MAPETSLATTSTARSVGELALERAKLRGPLPGKWAARYAPR